MPQEQIEDIPSNEEILRAAAESRDEFYKSVFTAIESESPPESIVESPKPYTDLANGYVSFNGKHMSKDVLKDMHPELFVKADSITAREISTNFGIAFPATALKGDIFVRVDMLPNQVFKYDGMKWFQVNKELTTSYLQEPDYIQHLINKVDSGEYDVNLLTENEKQQIEDYLNNQKV